MRIPVPPPDLAAYGAALAHVARGSHAANAAGTPGAGVAQAMALLCGEAPGHDDSVARWTQLGGRISQALDSAGAPADLPVLVARSARAASLARLFAGAPACP